MVRTQQPNNAVNAKGGTYRFIRFGYSSTVLVYITEGAKMPEYMRADYISRQKVFGLPLLHVSSDVARGVVAVGERAYGVVAFGKVACGAISAGAVSLGLVSAGAISVGLLAASGAVALSFKRAAGAIAIGKCARGALAMGGNVEGGITFRYGSEDSARE